MWLAKSRSHIATRLSPFNWQKQKPAFALFSVLCEHCKTALLEKNIQPNLEHASETLWRLSPKGTHFFSNPHRATFPLALTKVRKREQMNSEGIYWLWWRDYHNRKQWHFTPPSLLWCALFHLYLPWPSIKRQWNPIYTYLSIIRQKMIDLFLCCADRARNPVNSWHEVHTLFPSHRLTIHVHTTQRQKVCKNTGPQENASRTTAISQGTKQEQGRVLCSNGSKAILTGKKSAWQPQNSAFTCSSSNKPMRKRPFQIRSDVRRFELPFLLPERFCTKHSWWRSVLGLNQVNVSIDSTILVKCLSCTSEDDYTDDAWCGGRASSLECQDVIYSLCKPPSPKVLNTSGTSGHIACGFPAL